MLFLMEDASYGKRTKILVSFHRIAEVWFVYEDRQRYKDMNI